MDAPNDINDYTHVGAILTDDGHGDFYWTHYLLPLPNQVLNIIVRYAGGNRSLSDWPKSCQQLFILYQGSDDKLDPKMVANEYCMAVTATGKLELKHELNRAIGFFLGQFTDEDVPPPTVHLLHAILTTAIHHVDEKFVEDVVYTYPQAVPYYTINSGNLTYLDGVTCHGKARCIRRLVMAGAHCKFNHPRLWELGGNFREILRGLPMYKDLEGTKRYY